MTHSSSEPAVSIVPTCQGSHTLTVIAKDKCHIYQHAKSSHLSLELSCLILIYFFLLFRMFCCWWLSSRGFLTTCKEAGFYSCVFLLLPDKSTEKLFQNSFINLLLHLLLISFILLCVIVKMHINFKRFWGKYGNTDNADTSCGNSSIYNRKNLRNERRWLSILNSMAPG